MYIMPAKNAGLIYPYDKDDKRNANELVASSPRTIFGYEGTVRTYGVPIPVKESYSDFVDCMKSLETKIKAFAWK